MASRINRAIELLAQDQAIYYVGGHTGHAVIFDRGRVPGPTTSNSGWSRDRDGGARRIYERPGRGQRHRFGPPHAGSNLRGSGQRRRAANIRFNTWQFRQPNGRCARSSRGANPGARFAIPEPRSELIDVSRPDTEAIEVADGPAGSRAPPSVKNDPAGDKIADKWNHQDQAIDDRLKCRGCQPSGNQQEILLVDYLQSVPDLPKVALIELTLVDCDVGLLGAIDALDHPRIDRLAHEAGLPDHLEPRMRIRLVPEHRASLL